ncbi:lectin [Luteimonas vadosa]|uniref:Lectin n=1 Tax=Luteimonas vadosa TaxID=1165507 RepID=A0ABP9DSD3_9GAMM
MPRRHLPLPLLAASLVLGLAACDGGAPDTSLPADADAAPTTVDAPAAPPPPTSASPAPVDEGAAGYDGYGEARFGMTADAVRAAWEGALAAVPDASEPCYFLYPAGNATPADFAMMIEGDRFVRYSVGRGNTVETAPGGGKVGMGAGDVEALYPGRVATSPHKYVDGGQYLRIRARDDGPGVLVFETDAAGKVTEWRVGTPPQVDYVEGCS